MKIAVIVPTIRPASFAAFIKAWDGFSGLANLYVMEDAERKIVEAPEHANHFCWHDIEADLKDKAWIIPRQTDCVRSYGYYRAWLDGNDYFITLDDDCYPPQSITPQVFVDAHIQNMTTEYVSDAWQDVLVGVKTRGYPYHNTTRKRIACISHGLWDNVVDMDAVTQLSSPQRYGEYCEGTIESGKYFTMCGMNLAWSRRMAPAMYFLLMGGKHGYDRWGDIWCGLIVKKIADHLNIGVYSGQPHVWHDRASNVWSNLRKEASGLEYNETLWAWIDSLVLTSNTVLGCYRQVAKHLDGYNDYWNKASEAMMIWADLHDGANHG